MTEITKTEPTNEDFVTLFTALIDEAKAGRVRAVVFALGIEGQGDNMLIDAYGSHELVEIATRKQHEEVVKAVRKTNFALAGAIKKGMVL